MALYHGLSTSLAADYRGRGTEWRARKVRSGRERGVGGLI